jgi:hypothetical protein
VSLWGSQASQRFVVLGQYADGLERDVTTDSTFVVTNPSVAGLEPVGRIRALANGTTKLRAEIAGDSATAAIRVEQVEAIRPFSFSYDIGQILTKRGCNSAECHGGVKGRGGFKLSMDCLYPREDYKWIVEGGIYQVLSAESGGPKPPRVDLKEPEKSLLLLKPTLSLPHGGGLRFGSDSADYQAILRWVRKGAPYGAEQIATVKRVEVIPPETVLDMQGRQQLLLTAYLSDGRREDVTDQARYESNNPEVVKVDESGRVKAVAPGETAVIVRVAGQAVSARFGVIAKPLESFPELPRTSFIDERVFRKLQKFQILPSEVSSDAEFLRRVCLDVTGTLPPPSRVREFLADKDPAKREKLIDTLLGSPEYVDYWTFRFSDLFRVGGGVRLPPGSDAYSEWIRDSITSNKPYDQIARERIAAQGYDGPSRHLQAFGKVPPAEMVASEEMRVFMGRRLDCAQCHNHPYDRWSQDQFWALAAFYGRMTNTGFNFNQVVYDDADGQELDYGVMGKTSLNFIKIIHPRTKQEVEPAFFDGQRIESSARQDPRMWFAQRMTSHPYFAEAAVNRIWSYFFGRGLVHPVDDFRSTNPPTHPNLLKALAEEFQKSHFDLRHLIRTIVLSRTYQLSGRSNPSSRNDELNYSHALPRPLEAEVLLDAISDVTGVPELFETPMGGRSAKGTRAIQLKVPDNHPSHFLEVYGRPIRDAIPERDGKANLGQALHMLVGPTYTQKLSREGGTVDRLLKNGASDQEIIAELFLAALSRFPSKEEEAELQQAIRSRASRRQSIENLLWALINSREFAFNH